MTFLPVTHCALSDIIYLSYLFFHPGKGSCRNRFNSRSLDSSPYWIRYSRVRGSRESEEFWWGRECKIKNRGLERKEKIKVTKKNKRIYFLYSEFTLTAILFWAPAVTFQDWSSYNLTFGNICFFFVCHPSISPLPCRCTWPLSHF